MLILEKSPIELKSIVGKRTTENGQIVRMNKIAFEQIKFTLRSKDAQKKQRLHLMFGDDYTNDSIVRHTMDAMSRLGYYTIDLDGIGIKMNVQGYKTDNLHGICEDGDVNCIRLVKDDGKVIKKKVGKVVSEYLRNNGYLCEQAITFVSETIAQHWKAYASEHSTKQEFSLVVDDDFESIYCGGNQVGDFHSCMNGNSGINFYYEIDASAASLRNSNGEIVARCVVFNDVHDNNGNKYRYAERQYSTAQDLTLQQILINKLYDGNYIDLHKRVGASCWDSSDVVDKNNKPFEEKLYIEHCLEDGDYCPFMDGFAYYDSKSERLYNRTFYGCEELHSTDGYYNDDSIYCEHCGNRISEDERCWSDYEQEDLCEDCAQWCDEIDDYCLRDNAVEVYYENGRSSYMPEDWNERRYNSNFVYIESECEYHFEDHVSYDDLNDEYILSEKAVEYKSMYNGKWLSYITSEDEIDNNIVEFEGEYYSIDDCEEIDGVWYPCDQLPEQAEEVA